MWITSSNTDGRRALRDELVQEPRPQQVEIGPPVYLTHQKL